VIGAPLYGTGLGLIATSRFATVAAGAGVGAGVGAGSGVGVGAGVVASGVGDVGDDSVLPHWTLTNAAMSARPADHARTDLVDLDMKNS
jgi:hypothetical protein